MLPEKDIETVLYYRPDLLHGLFRVGDLRWLARQYNVPSGRIDLLGRWDFETSKSAVVVELKRGPIDSDAIAQVARYAGDIQEIIDNIAGIHGILTVADSRVYKVLIGQSIDYPSYLAAQGLGIVTWGYSTDKSGKLYFGPIHFKNDGKRWSLYDQLSDDSPFEYWVNKARIELEYIQSLPHSPNSSEGGL